MNIDILKDSLKEKGFCEEQIDNILLSIDNNEKNIENIFLLTDNDDILSMKFFKKFEDMLIFKSNDLKNPIYISVNNNEESFFEKGENSHSLLTTKGEYPLRDLEDLIKRLSNNSIYLGRNSGISYNSPFDGGFPNNPMIMMSNEIEKEKSLKLLGLILQGDYIESDFDYSEHMKNYVVFKTIEEAIEFSRNRLSKRMEKLNEIEKESKKKYLYYEFKESNISRDVDVKGVIKWLKVRKDGKTFKLFPNDIKEFYRGVGFGVGRNIHLLELFSFSNITKIKIGDKTYKKDEFEIIRIGETDRVIKIEDK